jgi:PhnB protein
MAAKKKTSKRKVKPVPKGYGTVTATMNQTDASATIAFCKQAFGAKLRMKMPGPGGKLMHAEIEIGDSVVMLSDAMQEPARASSLFLYVPNVDKTMAKAVKAGAKVVMPAMDMFWGDRFGSLVDPYGNKWAVGTRVENVSPAELKKRMKAAAKEMSAGRPPTRGATDGG